MRDDWSFSTSVHVFDDGGELHEWVVYGPAERRGYWTCQGSGTACTAEQAIERAESYIAARVGVIGV